MTIPTPFFIYLFGLPVGSSYVFFQAKLRIRQQEAENAITLKQLKVETLNLELRWVTYESFFVEFLGAIDHVIQVSEPKIQMAIEGFNSSSSKTNRSSGIKVSNLEASGQAVSGINNKL